MREEEQRRGGKESKGSKRGRKFIAPERELVQSWKTTTKKKEIEAVGSNPGLRQHSLSEAGPGLQQGCGKGVLQPGAQAPGQEWG